MTSPNDPGRVMEVGSARGERGTADHRVFVFLAGFACAAAVGVVAFVVAT